MHVLVPKLLLKTSYVSPQIFLENEFLKVEFLCQNHFVQIASFLRKVVPIDLLIITVGKWLIPRKYSPHSYHTTLNPDQLVLKQWSSSLMTHQAHLGLYDACK